MKIYKGTLNGKKYNCITQYYYRYQKCYQGLLTHNHQYQGLLAHKHACLHKRIYTHTLSAERRLCRFMISEISIIYFYAASVYVCIDLK